MLPIIPMNVNHSCSKSILDFTKFKILSLDEYTMVVERLQEAKENATREKKRWWKEKDAAKQKKTTLRKSCVVEVFDVRMWRLAEK